MTYRASFVWMFCLLLGAGSIAATSDQNSKRDRPYALIFGTVWGPDDQPVYGVKVKIRRQDDKKARWELISDHSGEFAQRVPAGKADYIITADLKGFKAQNGVHLQLPEDVHVHVEFDERVDTGVHLK